MRRWLTSVLIAIVGVGLGAGSLAAQSTDNSTPPMSDAVVAHLSAMSGSVSTSRSDTGTWVAGALNTPLVTGDKVAAGAGGRAEVQMDYADFLRLGDNANATLANLTSKQIQVQLGSGLADYVVLKGYQAVSEIDTPNIAIYPQKAGVYRILVSSNNQTQVIVRKGEAEISTPQGSTKLKQGQQITVEGVETPEYQITDAPAKDSWDRWNEDRDSALEVAQRDNHVNQYYTGSQDLNQYGYWTTVPGYGQVWVPSNAGPDWTPYSDGRWTWEPYWGWTWVTYEPWGWAPFHYGRWFVYGPRWVWWPGPVTPFYRPIWAPAYVSFFGFGVGFGSIGWLPIGPGDYYRPWWGGRGLYSVSYTNIYINNYGSGNRYRRRVMPPLAVASHQRVVYSNITAMRTNARVRAAVIRVPQTQFAHGGIQGRNHVSVAELHRSSVLGGTLPVVPTHASLSVHRSERPVSAPAHQVNHFFGSRGTVAAEPRFSQERANVTREVHGAAPARQVAPRAVTPRAVQPERPPRFESSGTLRPQSPAPPARAARPGFQPFRSNPQPPRAMPRPAQPQAQPPQPRIPHQAAPAQRNDNHPGFQPFTRQPDQPQADQAPRVFTPREPQPPQERGFTPRGQPQRFEPQAQPRQAPPQRFSRPPLQMGHPIVSAPPRHNPPPQIPHYSAPRMSEPHYSAPRMSAPPHYSAPRMSAPPAPHVSTPHVERGGGGPGHPHQR